MTKVFDNTIITLQNDIAYDASNLNGVSINSRNYNVCLVWFTPTGSYDGTINFEISPDAGTSWFGTTGYYTGDVSQTLVASVTSPVNTRLYVVLLGVNSEFRVRMNGGTMGSLTVYGKLSRYYS